MARWQYIAGCDTEDCCANVPAHSIDPVYDDATGVVVCADCGHTLERMSRAEYAPGMLTSADRDTIVGTLRVALQDAIREVDRLVLEREDACCDECADYRDDGRLYRARLAVADLRSALEAVQSMATSADDDDDRCADCGDTADMSLDGIPTCGACAILCDSCGAGSIDGRPHPVKAADGMLLRLCDGCASIDTDAVPAWARARGY